VDECKPLLGGDVDPGYYNVSVTTDESGGNSFVPDWFRYPAGAYTRPLFGPA